jgi:hypothetical protein
MYRCFLIYSYKYYMLRPTLLRIVVDVGYLVYCLFNLKIKLSNSFLYCLSIFLFIASIFLFFKTNVFVVQLK